LHSCEQKNLRNQPIKSSVKSMGRVRRGILPAGNKPGIDGFQLGRVNPGLGLGGHEIYIVFPAGNHMDMNVMRDSRSGSFSDIDADVEPMGGERGFEECHRCVHSVPKIFLFPARKLLKFRDFAVGNDKTVTGIVRIPVQQDENRFGSEKNKMGGIVLSLADSTEEFRSTAFIFCRDISIAPGSPKMFHKISQSW